MEHKIDDILQSVFAEMRREKPQRQLVLRSEPDRQDTGPARRPSGGRSLPMRLVRRPVVLRLAVALTGIAAAIVAGVFLLVPTHRSHSDEFVCYVNGVQIVDEQMALEHTRQALGIASAGVEKTIERVDEIFNKISQTY